MNDRFAGKNAVVTGGTAGIGKNIVTALSAQGATVLFTGTNPERGAEVAKATGATFLKMDARQGDQAERIAEQAAAMGGVHMLINNAGSMGLAQNVENTTIEAFEDTFRLHLWAPWKLMSAIAGVMRGNGGGSIVNVASVAAHRVGASSVAYSVAKAGVLHLTRCAAAEFGRDNIRVNSISPGFIPTQIHASGLPGGEDRKLRFVDGLGRMFLNRQAIDHPGTASDIAGLVLFLVSDEAAFITGADMVADGGLMWGQAGMMK